MEENGEENKEQLFQETWHAMLEISRIAYPFYNRDLPHLTATIAAVKSMQLMLSENKIENRNLLWEKENQRDRFLLKIRKVRRQRRKLRATLSNVFDILEKTITEK